MRYKPDPTALFLILLEIVCCVAIFLVPLDLLEYLALEVVGEPPINGKSWLEGVQSFGGELSMKILAIIGVIIMVHTAYFILKLKDIEIQEREVSNLEVSIFFLTAICFFIVNFLIGYAWWDPNGFLGMGPLFFHSIISLVILGMMPFILKRIFKFNTEDLAVSTNNFVSFAFTMMFIAYGYGLVSGLWHCCSFFNNTMYFFFFVIKLIQLWGMLSFFFMYGFKLLLNKTKPWVAYTMIALLFGFCYPWHTLGFALMFTFFGLVLCILVRKTDSFLPGLILLYFAYIFHAGLSWNGPVITFTIIYPISLLILGVILYSNIRLKI